MEAGPTQDEIAASQPKLRTRISELASTLNTLGLLVASVLLFAYFWWRLPGTFLSFYNIETIARQATIVSMAALGMTLIIISGAIDLSIGSVVALVTVVIATALPKLGPWGAILAGVGIASLAGYLNGLIVAKMRVVSFVVTLGGLSIFRGIARWVGSDNTVSAPKTWINDLLTVLGEKERWMLFPLGVWVTVLMAIGVSVLLKKTVFGRHVFAIGSNETAAKMSGVHVDRVKIGVFVLGGLFTGLAGLMQFSRLTVGDPTVAVGLELDVIAAVVIGGASLAGGQGSIFGSIIGAVFITTLANGFAQMGVQEYKKQIITGAIIVVAVALDRLRARGR